MVAFELIKCFAPAAAANLFFHSLFSLRMGRVIEREIAALAAPKGTVQLMNEMNGLLFLRRQRYLLNWVGLFLLLVGYERSSAPWLRRKEESNNTNSMKTNEAERKSGANKPINLSLLSSLFWIMKWNEIIQWRRKGADWLGLWVEPAPRSQKLRGKPLFHQSTLLSSSFIHQSNQSNSMKSIKRREEK